ncbi:MAG TPA: hypothetical protein PL168_08705 [Methanobacterium sp.]|nr:hypothetical protein [Methanobacterium sp.]
MKTKNNNKIMIGVSCQCQKPAISRPSSHLRKVQCQKCGKIFKTNRDLNHQGLYTCCKCRERK